MRMIFSGVWRLRFMGLLLAKSGRQGISHKDWFSFLGPRQLPGARYSLAQAPIASELKPFTAVILA
jgi:hypothetical protein